ncbi:MAG TPA: HAD family phosphatase [Anaerolineales bacterium]|nr:HAD family phosphatase [Anaerolineales bacterium]
MSIRAVIFDFGGVLIQMVNEQPRLELAEQLGVPLSRIDQLVFFSETARKASQGEIGVALHWQAVGQALGIAPEEMPSFLDKYWSADDVNWKLLDYIRSLHPRFKVGLLSNAWDDLRQTMHQRWNIDRFFDVMVISAEVKLVKPDPRIFHLAVERLQVQPSEAVFVDDMPENVEAAKREGLLSIQYEELDQTLSELKRLLSSG